MTITEVCKKYGLTADTLRYYERVGLLPRVRRTSGGVRDYSDSDCGWVEFVKCMRGAGVGVEALAEYVGLFKDGGSTAEARKRILVRERDRMAKRADEMREALERLNFKIEQYDSVMIPAERELLGGSPSGTAAKSSRA